MKEKKRRKNPVVKKKSFTLVSLKKVLINQKKVLLRPYSQQDPMRRVNYSELSTENGYSVSSTNGITNTITQHTLRQATCGQAHCISCEGIT